MSLASSVRFSGCLLALVGGATVVWSWRQSRAPMRTGEVIVASIIGERPFSDSIHTVSSEGHVKTVLSASARESYPGVHALSMQQPFVVVVNELAGDRVRRS